MNAVVFGPTTPTVVNLVSAADRRWMMKPDSFAAVSLQKRLICVPEAARAIRPVGGGGGSAGMGAYDQLRICWVAGPAAVKPTYPWLVPRNCGMLIGYFRVKAPVPSVSTMVCVRTFLW